MTCKNQTDSLIKRIFAVSLIGGEGIWYLNRVCFYLQKIVLMLQNIKNPGRNSGAGFTMCMFQSVFFLRHGEGITLLWLSLERDWNVCCYLVFRILRENQPPTSQTLSARFRQG